MMKYIFKTVTLLTLQCAICGCSTALKGWDNWVEYSNRQQKTSDDQVRVRREEIKTMHQAVVIGNTFENFTDAWGKPEYIEAMKNTKYLHYESYQGEPTIFVFEDDKLVGWQKDTQKTQLLQADESLRAQKESTRKAAIINMMNSNRPRNCTTSYVGQTAFTNCN